MILSLACRTYQCLQDSRPSRNTNGFDPTSVSELKPISRQILPFNSATSKAQAAAATACYCQGDEDPNKKGLRCALTCFAATESLGMPHP